MKSLIEKLKFWISHHDTKAKEAKQLDIPVLQAHHADQACMARQVLDSLPKEWKVYQLERVLIIGMKKQTDSLGLFFDISDAVAKLNHVKDRRIHKGYALTYLSVDECEADLVRTNDQGQEIEVSLTVRTLNVH